MKTQTVQYSLATVLLVGSLGLFAAGCKTAKSSCSDVLPAVAERTALPTIRIKAGVTVPIKDSSGNEWLADHGFADGETIERPELKIEGTPDQAIYQAERYGMTKFVQPLPAGKYLVKLHFAETYDGITDKGQRVFSFNVEGQEFKDFDVWAKAGGALRAYVETVLVEIADGQLDITFTPTIENPEINGLEIRPAAP